MEKIELHLHTKGLSPCAKVEPEEAAETLVKCGYTAAVVTNHYMRWLFEEYYDARLTKTQRTEYFLSGYRRMKKAGEPLGLKVFLGAEMNLDYSNLDERTHPGFEFLSYGITEEFLLEHPELYRMRQRELFELYEENGFLMVQAHPFRTKTYLSDYRYLHGAEVYNGNPRHNSYNEIAAFFAQAHGLIPTAGSDYHDPGDENRAWITTECGVHTNADVVSVLRSGRYQCHHEREEGK